MNVHAGWQFDSRYDNEFYRGAVVDNATGCATARTEQAYAKPAEAIAEAQEMIDALVSA